MAYNYNKKPVSEHVYEDRTVWQCSDCNTWSRPEFVLDEEPTCPICHGKMEQVVRNIRVE
ncbi:cold-inducible protein YdjO-related protein [Alicyclobacillus sp. SO9]|uniref:cold-inducible protein YdjO-related protein n=1 Tax=Alicyclobacillus sp. SO9 TaxID=2665646 RepID=UPI0018E7F200|nr:cold-inducible protein YdjO-related protein [Alicyclobacillus sp. SO9]QQE78275.1 hypothetical protein GI364_20725 [Alicyclobacillus sp. SO9]